MAEGLLNVYRNEWKYYINVAEYEYLKMMLDLVVDKDAYSVNKGEYYIRSLYFDSVDNIDYTTKMMGIQYRKKIRLRIYDTKAQTVKLEVKNRYNTYMLKESLTISKDHAIEMINGNYNVLDYYNRNVARKVTNIMKQGEYSPRVIVDYDREAFTYPEHNVRITFDKSIRAYSSEELFSDNLPMIPLIHDPVMVLEVKYNQMLPEYIKNVISSASLMSSSISKYCMARELLG